MEGIDVVKRGQALVERAGLRGRRGNRIRDVSHEKGLPLHGTMGVQRQSVEA